MALSFLLFALPALACSPANDDPWFRIAAVTFSALPAPAIQLQARNEHGTWHVGVENSDAEPIYLVNTRSPPGSSYARPGAGVPQDWVPFYKVASGQAYEWVSRNEAATRTDNGSWQPYRLGHLEVPFGRFLTPKQGEYRNLSPDGPRPPSAVPPADSENILHAWYRGAPVEISAKISYELYPDYVPDRFQRGVAACSAIDLAQAGWGVRLKHFVNSMLRRWGLLP